jgi:hypothetical protein
MEPVPLDAEPMEKFVIVFDPPEHAGKLIVPAGETEFDVTVQPAVDRETATRA